MFLLIIPIVSYLFCSTAAFPSTHHQDNNGCFPHEFWCHSNKMCILKNFMCDGISDCSNGEDEEDCIGYACQPGEFQCLTNGQRICHPVFYQCDGEDDCDFGTDEISCKHFKRKRNDSQDIKKKENRRNPFYFYKYKK